MPFNCRSADLDGGGELNLEELTSEIHKQTRDHIVVNSNFFNLKGLLLVFAGTPLLKRAKSDSQRYPYKLCLTVTFLKKPQ